MHRLEKLNKLSINIFELTFYHDQNKKKHNLVPIGISKNESDKVFDLLIYKNHYSFIIKLNVFLGDHHKSFTCRRFMNSFASETMLMMHKLNSGDYDITTIGTSKEI